MPFHLAEAGFGELAVVAVVAFLTSILGGLTGYGVGLILPAFLVPVVGVGGVIPVMSIGMAMTNGSRVFVFRRQVAWRHAGAALILGLPLGFVGAYLYTLLSVKLVGLAVGAFLVASVPIRRLLARREYRLGRRGMVIAGGAYGLVAGGMTGTGLMIMSALMAAGVHGAALVGTDAAIAVVINLAKALVFGTANLIDAELLIFGALIGCCTAPGAFVARQLLARIPIHIHTGFMDALVAVGGALFIWAAFR
jgi:uncharacterized membrane protein YfcA